MKKIYVNKSFLKNFTFLLLLLLLITVLIVGSVYQMSVRALEKEVTTLNQNNTYELADRVNGIIDQAKNIAGRLISEDSIRMYFYYSNPEYLMNRYYDETSGKLQAHGLSYIDSIMLYAPKYQRVFGGTNYDRSYTLDEIKQADKTKNIFDVTWLDEISEEERSEIRLFTRARNNEWPYYLSVMTHWRSGDSEGVVLVNIDLIDLYDYVISERNNTTKFYIIDGAQRVILKEKQRALYTSLEQCFGLERFRLGESFSELFTDSGEGYAYVQVYSEEYGFTFVTVTKISDYLVQITQVQNRFLHLSFLAVIVAIALACIYSIKLVRPLQEIRKVLEDSAEWKEKKELQHSEEIRDIVDMIMGHLQTNTYLRQELDDRLETLKNTQLIALQSQINPHFLFNTLNTISVLVESECGDNHAGVQMISELSEILRYALSENDIVSIQKEMEYVKRYLFIMQYRYDEFEVCFRVEEKLYQYAIPKLVLQPLIENALQHGIAPCLGIRTGRLEILAQEEKHIYADGKMRNSICIDIRDNGIGMDEKQLEELRKSIADNKQISGKHIGVANVAKRFYLLFQNEQELTVESMLGKGTHIRIIFPVVDCEMGLM